MFFPSYQQYLKSRSRLLSFANEEELIETDLEVDPVVPIVPASVLSDSAWQEIKTKISEFYGKFLNPSSLAIVLDYDDTTKKAIRNKNRWFSYILNSFVLKNAPKNIFKELINIYEDVFNDEKDANNIKALYNKSFQLYEFLRDNVSQFRNYHAAWSRDVSSGRTGKQELTLDKRAFERVLTEFLEELRDLNLRLENFVTKKLGDIGEKVERKVALHGSAYYDKVRRERPDALIIIGLGNPDGTLNINAFNLVKQKALSGEFPEERYSLNRYFNAVYRKGPSPITAESARRAVALFLGWSSSGLDEPIGTTRLNIIHDDNSLQTIEEMEKRVKDLETQSQIAKSQGIKYGGQRKFDDLHRDLKERIDKLLDRILEKRMEERPISTEFSQETIENRKREREEQAQELAQRRLRSIEEKKIKAEEELRLQEEERKRQENLLSAPKNIKQIDKDQKFVENSPVIYTTKEGNQYDAVVENIVRDNNEISSIRVKYLDESNNYKSKLLSGDSTAVKHKMPGEQSLITPDTTKSATSSYILHALASESPQIVAAFIKKFKELKRNRG